MSDTFIVEDIGIDLFGISWERAERISNFEETIVSVIADCKLLYVNSDEDFRRFDSLRKNISVLCDSKNREKLLQKASEKMENVFVNVYKLFKAETENDNSSARIEANNIMVTVFEVLSLINQKYLKKGWGKNFTEIMQFEYKPENLADTINAIINTCEIKTINKHCNYLIEAVLKIIEGLRSEYAYKKQYPEVFSGFYEEIKSVFNKIIHACDTGDYMTVYFYTVQLHEEIGCMIYMLETGVQQEKYESFRKIEKEMHKKGIDSLIGKLGNTDLSKFKESVVDFEKKFLNLLTEEKVKIKEFGNIEEYEKYFNKKR